MFKVNKAGQDDANTEDTAALYKNIKYTNYKCNKTPRCNVKLIILTNLNKAELCTVNSTHSSDQQ